MQANELKQLVIAWAMLSLAFGIARSGLDDSASLAMSVLLAFITVGIAFVVHELSHRTVARHFGKHAEFQADYKMLFFAIITSFFGVILAAPGAVVISGRTTLRELGLISMSGPLSNIILAVLFLMLRVLSPQGMLALIASYGFWINAFLALFNMIPFGMFDGKKIKAWNPSVFWAMILFSGLLVIGAIGY